MEGLNIRPAQLSDLPILHDFEQGIIKYERPYDVTLKPDPISYYDLEAMIKSSETEVIVATVNNEIVGSAYAQIRNAKPYLNHSEYAYLGFMFVHPDFRGKGINKSIIEGLKEWVHSKGISEMRLDVYSENEAALRAYEKAGFQKLLINMRLKI